MAGRRPRPLFSVVGGLLVYYWFGLSAWGILSAGEIPPDWIALVKEHLFWWAYGAAAAVVLTTSFVFARRLWKLAELEGETWRDWHWSIGPFPVKPPVPASVKRFNPDTSRLHLPEAVRDSHWEVQWREYLSNEYSGGRSTARQYINLFEAVWRVLDHHRHVPAGVVRGASASAPLRRTFFQRLLLWCVDWRRLPRWYLDRLRREALESSAKSPRHGRFTLWAHSYTTAWAMVELAKTWNYDKARAVWHAARGTHRRAKPVQADPGFKFDPQDPMIAILGLAHDLGKLKVYREVEPGVWESSGAKHANESARSLAALDPWWEIAAVDKITTDTVISSYHEIRDLQEDVRPDAEDDRNFCLAMLLVEADQLALRLQGCEALASEEDDEPAQGAGASESGISRAAAFELDPDGEERVVLEAFLADVLRPGRVSLANAHQSLGQRVRMAVKSREGLVEDQDVLIVSLAPALRSTFFRLAKDHQAHFHRKQGTLQRALLSALMREGLLITELPDCSLDPAVDAWSASWMGTHPNHQTRRVTETLVLLLRAGGPLLRVGVLDSLPRYPLRPMVRLNKGALAPKVVPSGAQGPEDPPQTGVPPTPGDAGDGEDAGDAGGATGGAAGDAPGVPGDTAPGAPAGGQPGGIASGGAATGTNAASQEVPTGADLERVRALGLMAAKDWIMHSPAVEEYPPEVLGGKALYRIPLSAAMADPWLKHLFIGQTLRALGGRALDFAYVDKSGPEAMLILDRLAIARRL